MHIRITSAGVCISMRKIIFCFGVAITVRRDIFTSGMFAKMTLGRCAIFLLSPIFTIFMGFPWRPLVVKFYLCVILVTLRYM